MESSAGRRVLIVANRTASTPTLLDEVKRLAQEQPTTFALLIPDMQKGEHTDWTLELALPLLERAAGAPVDAMIGVPEPLAAIQDAINLHGFDEVIVSTLPTRVSKWLKLDLPHKVAGLGLPVTTVTAQGTERIEAHA
jgi:hypothetical protein